MRILQIATQVPVPPIDGGKLSVYGITKSLNDRRHKIDFVCYRKHDDFEKSYKLLKEICTPYILDVKTDNNLLGVAINLFSSIPYNASKYRNSKLKKFLKDYFQKNHPDVIHIDHLFLGWAVDLIRSFTSVPVVLRAQNIEMNIMKRFYEVQKNPFLKLYSGLQLKKFKSYEPRICAKFDLCIMMSDIDKNTLQKHDLTLNISSLPAGVESSLLEIAKEDIIPFSLVHIGHTDWYPNYDGLSWFINEVMPDLVKTIPQIKLYIYGGGKTHGFLVPSSMKNYVHVVGFVENLWKELKNKSLAVVPLRIGSGIRIKILELLATGTNVITTSIGKEGINVLDGKEVIVADTKKEFYEKISRYFNGEYDITRMQKNGREFILNNNTWEKISQKLENLYLNLVEKKAR